MARCKIAQDTRAELAEQLTKADVRAEFSRHYLNLRDKMALTGLFPNLSGEWEMFISWLVQIGVAPEEALLWSCPKSPHAEVIKAARRHVVHGIQANSPLYTICLLDGFRRSDSPAQSSSSPHADQVIQEEPVDFPVHQSQMARTGEAKNICSLCLTHI